MLDRKRIHILRASTSKLLPNSEWEPFQKIIDNQVRNKDKETGATKMLTRYVQGIRRYCPKCKRFVTPYLDIENDKDGITVAMYLRCDCGRVIGDGKIV